MDNKLKLKAIYGFPIYDDRYSVSLYVFPEGSDEEKEAEFYVNKINEINKFDDDYSQFQDLFIDVYTPEISKKELTSNPFIRVEIFGVDEKFFEVCNLQGKEEFYTDYYGKAYYVTYFSYSDITGKNINDVYHQWINKHPDIIEKLEKINQGSNT